MKLFCKTCAKPILPQDINLEMAIAKCAGCGEVFSFLDDLGSESPPHKQPQPLPAPRPKRFNVEEFGSELTISYRWFTPALFFVAAFCLFWDGFMVAWYSIALGLIWQGQPAAWGMAAIGLLHLTIGICLTYSTIANFINRTVIRISGGELTVRHGPIRWTGNHTVRVEEVLQLYCADRKHRNKRGTWTTYSIHILNRDGSSLALLTGFADKGEALFLAECLEQKLGIAPQHVPGEIRP